METNKIYSESCLETLKRMPDDFLDCVITSPPYFGLRSYNTEPQIWGGDGDCQHQWGSTLPFAKQDNRTAEEKAAQGAQVGSHINFNEETTTATSGQFCSHCNAWKGELGLEPTFQLYLDHLVMIFREVKRVLKPTGTVWVNLGDSYAGSGKGIGSDHGKGVFTDSDIAKTDWSSCSVRLKSLMNIPHRFYIAMTDELGMIQRNNIVWHKPACMPSSAKDRFTVDFESIGFFTKNEKYYFEQQLEDIKQVSLDRVKTGWTSNHPSIGEIDVEQMGERFAHPDGRNMRSTWSINFEPSGEEHYASYPTRLVERMMRAGCPEKVCADCYAPYVWREEVVGTQITEAMRIAGCDNNGEYHGNATKDFDGNQVQNASELKRRVLRSMAQVKERQLVQNCPCETAETLAGVVYDPFGGTATTAVAAHRLGRRWICSELQPKYVEISENRLEPLLNQNRLFV